MITVRGTGKYSEGKQTLSIIQPTWTALGLNLGLRGGDLVTN
jgi:hypothetical protein